MSDITAKTQRAQRALILCLPLRRPADIKAMHLKNHRIPMHDDLIKVSHFTARGACGFYFPPSQQKVKKAKTLCGLRASSPSAGVTGGE
jgi:hypothetical protein